MQTYTVRKTSLPEKLDGAWNSPAWCVADIARIDAFRPESGVHRPTTNARLLYDSEGIHGIFEVQDRYVRCVRTKYMDEVWKDSCVELFLQPKADKGYFNFEFNCGGAFLCCYITNPERTPSGFKDFVKIPFLQGQQVTTVASLPKVVDPEIVLPVVWTLKFSIPFALLEEFVGPIGEVDGTTWRGNFYKCAEENSHPHWASWLPVDEFNFHLPRCFGALRFEL